MTEDSGLKIGDRVRVLEIPGEPEMTARDCPYETEIVDELIQDWFAVPQKTGDTRWGVRAEHVEVLS